MPQQPHANVESSLWGRFCFHRPRQALRIGILADGPALQAWLGPVINSMTAHGVVESIDVFFFAQSSDTSAASSSWLFRKLERWSRGREQDGFAPADSLPESARRHQLSGSISSGLTPGDRELISSWKPDVLLIETASSLKGDCTGVARLGVWSFLFGEPEFRATCPPYWREALEASSVSSVSLLVHDRFFEKGRIVESFATPNLASLRFTCDQAAPLSAAGLALVRTLTKAAERQQSPKGGVEIVIGSGEPRLPSGMETAGFIAGKLQRSAVLRARARGKELRWVVGIRRNSGDSKLPDPGEGEPFAEIPNPRGHFYADPFIVESNSRHWLFLEDWIDCNGRACLVCMEVLPGGGFGEPAVILDKPYHLSYPHVFCHEGEFFMIPESADGGIVELYRATRFPFEWKPEAALMEDTRLVDTTPFHYEGSWYFFTSTVEQPEEAYLFTSNKIDGKWHYHPSNPISTDTRRLRGAGAIFRAGNALIRPAQDCSRGYGYQVAFNEILRLSPREYSERQVGRLGATWTPRLTGAHTFNADSEYQVVDGQKLCRRAAPDRADASMDK